MAQPASFAATTSAAPPLARGTPTLVGRGASRGGAQSSGGSDRFYAMRGRHNLEASPDVVTGIMPVQSHDLYALIDPGSTLSCVTPYVAMEFGIEPEQLHESFSVSTPIGESILAAQVYMDCVVTLRSQGTMADLIELGMVDYDVIMGMDCFILTFPSLIAEPGLKFVKGFSTLASPLTKLTQKAIKFQWSEAYERSFQELKARLTTTLVLTLPEGAYGFVKVVGDPTIIDPVETIEVNEQLTYEEIPVSIIDRQLRKLRNKEIASVKVLWRNQQVEEATWEAEEGMKKKYPYLFE
ncbi:uncharacterized protein [Nicotiana tomentosiformis]|uniref:uncharacterized protein n=1 Tax=Nicotiana tomentosiformis TaxID=4098 RepID=UPI00388CD52D